jgi:CMP-N-acetylneuraminic acid synthetase
MFKGKKVLGVVPARAGSKRLPGKNVAKIAGKPLICWTLEAAINSKYIDSVVLSTDDLNIAAVGGECYDLEVLIRPRGISDDNSPMVSVVENVIEQMEKRGSKFDYLVLLQPTSPLRRAEHIDEAFLTVTSKGGVGTVSICRTEHPQEWMGKIGSDDRLDSFFCQTQLEIQSQLFVPSYQVNGAIYIVPIDQFLEERTFFLRKGMIPYIMNRDVSIDIDEEFDLVIARTIFEQHKA